MTSAHRGQTDRWPHGRVRIRALPVGEFARLEPLWRALHEHHVQIAPALAGMPARSARAAWTRRLTCYVEWSRDPRSFVLVAEINGELVGYACVTVGRGYCSWDGGEPQGHLETLSVAPFARGQEVGGRLLGAVCRRLAAAGVASIALTSLCANEHAHRFYERHGLRTTEITFVGPVARAGERVRRTR